MKTIQIFRTLLLMTIAAFAISTLSACSDSSQWQATVYDTKGDSAGKVIGTYASRSECQEAGTMHFNSDMNKAREMMDSKGMSVACAIVASE